MRRLVKETCEAANRAANLKRKEARALKEERLKIAKLAKAQATNGPAAAQPSRWNNKDSDSDSELAENAEDAHSGPARK